MTVDLTLSRGSVVTSVILCFGNNPITAVNKQRREGHFKAAVQMPSDTELLIRGNEGEHYADTPPVKQRTAVSQPYIRPQSISLSHYLQYLSDCAYETHVTILICFIDWVWI